MTKKEERVCSEVIVTGRGADMVLCHLGARYSTDVFLVLIVFNFEVCGSCLSHENGFACLKNHQLRDFFSGEVRLVQRQM